MATLVWEEPLAMLAGPAILEKLVSKARPVARVPKDPKDRGVLKVLRGTWEQKAKPAFMEVLVALALLERLELTARLDLLEQLVQPVKQDLKAKQDLKEKQDLKAVLVLADLREPLVLLEPKEKLDRRDSLVQLASVVLLSPDRKEPKVKWDRKELLDPLVQLVMLVMKESTERLVPKDLKVALARMVSTVQLEQ